MFTVYRPNSIPREVNAEYMAISEIGALEFWDRVDSVKVIVEVYAPGQWTVCKRYD